MSEVDEKRAFNKMKHDWEPMRKIIVGIDKLLTWEKNYYPAIIFGSVTILYLLLWYLDMSTITMLSIAGLIAVVLDFLYPTLVRLAATGDEWSGKQEARYDHIVQQLFNIKMQLMAWYEYLFTNKEPKSTVFGIIMGSALLFMAWIGALINNYLLMYIITVAILLYPGIGDKRILQQLKQKICCILQQSSCKNVPLKEE